MSISTRKATASLEGNRMGAHRRWRLRTLIASAGILAAVLAGCAAPGTGPAGEPTRGPTDASEIPGGVCDLLSESAAAVAPELPDGLPCPEGGTEWTIGVLHVGDCPYCGRLYDSYQEQAKVLGVKLNILNGQLKPDLQAQQMDQMIAAKPDIIVAVPIDTKALIPGLARAQQAGIPVVDATIKTDESGDKYVVGYIGIDDTLAGQLSAELVLTGLEERGITSGTIAIVAGGAGGSEVLRTAGFKDEMAKNGAGFTLVGPEYTDFTKEDALAKTRDIISRIGDDLVAIWGEDDTLTSGIAQAAADAGATDRLVIVGMNGNQAGIGLIESGQIYGTVLQNPTLDAAWSIIYAVDYLEGKLPAQYIPLTQPKITSENVADFSPGW
jgi:ribose transport system substrate-binding protein